VDPPTYDSIVVPTMTGLDVIARLADTTVAAIRELNPQYLRLATPPGVRSVVRVPPGRGLSTAAAYAELPPSKRITFVEHTVARGETMSGIAHRYGVSTRLVTEANPRLRSNRLRPGQRVIVPTGGALSTSVARRMADPVEPAASSPSGYHRVRRGESLSGSPPNTASASASFVRGTHWGRARPSAPASGSAWWRRPGSGRRGP
jgi:FOG: LysM repeat